jgi:hypothetical protein
MSIRTPLTGPNLQADSLRSPARNCDEPDKDDDHREEDREPTHDCDSLHGQ